MNENKILKIDEILSVLREVGSFLVDRDNVEYDEAIHWLLDHKIVEWSTHQDDELIRI